MKGKKGNSKWKPDMRKRNFGCEDEIDVLNKKIQVLEDNQGGNIDDNTNYQPIFIFLSHFSTDEVVDENRKQEYDRKRNATPRIIEQTGKDQNGILPLCSAATV